MDERDQLQNSLGRNNAKLQRLQSEIKILETKLESAVSEKSSALADLANMLTKEQSLDYKEKRLESEKERLNNEIIILTEKLKDSTTELLVLRKANTQQTEDLLNVNTTICQLTDEINQLLTNQSEQNILKLKEQVDESVRLVDHYRKESDAKIRLADLYKESIDDCQVQLSKQATVIEDIKRQRAESTNQCRTLEGKLNDVEARHQIDMASKDEMIENLKQKLKMFETDTPETILEKLAPSAAAANRLLKGNLSLTEIYSRYYNVIENVNRKDYECTKLEMKFECVQSELNEKTLAFERQKLQYKKLLTVNEDLTQKVNSFIVEQDRHQIELEEIRSKFGNLERENAKLKSMQKDLARQICYLLNEIQASRCEVTSDQEQSKPSSMAANPAIAKKLVTFKDIEDMQENNLKLLLKVGELSAKVEEMKEIQQHINMQCYGEKISSYEKQLQDAEQLQRADKELLAICLQQKERFKQLYYDAMKDFLKTPPSEMNGIEDDTTVMSGTNIVKNAEIDGQDKRVSDEKMLQNEIKKLKEEYDDYRAGSSGNFELLNDELKEMRNKVKELISANCQLSSKVDVANVKIQNQENDIIVYKQLIETLEQRNQMYDKIIVKHELSIKYLTNEALDIIKKVSAAENQREYLQEECRRLINAKSYLERENQSFHQKNLHHSILQLDLEMMKVSSARLQFEGRLQMEQQLDKVTREFSDLRQKVDEEQNRLSEDAASLKYQAESAVKKMTDEQAQAEMLRSELKEERKQIELKNQQINDLSKKLQEALTPCKFDDSITKGNKKVKDLKLQMKSQAAEIEKLKNGLNTSIIQATELSKQVTVWENKSKVECDKFETCKAKLMSDLQASQLNETNLKSQVEQMELEIRLQKTGSHRKVQDELKEALQKNTEEKNRELSAKTEEQQQIIINMLQSKDVKRTLEMAEEKKQLKTCLHKCPRGAESSAEYCTYNSEGESASPQNKRNRLGEPKFNFGTVCDLEYQLPASSQRDDEDDDIMDAKSKDDDIENGATADAEIDSRNEVKSLAQHEEYLVPNDTYEVDVDDSSGAPNHSSNAALSGTRPNLTEAMETSPLQIQMISSGNDGNSDQGNTWTQVQRQHNLTIQKVYEEIGDNITVPSTPTLYVACKTDGYSEAVSSSLHVVAHAFEEMDGTRMNEESYDGDQSSSINAPLLDSDYQESVVVDMTEESSNENNEADQKEPFGGVSGRAEVTVPQIMVTATENEHNTFDDGGASTSQVNDDNVSVEVDPNDGEDVGTDGVSFEGEKLLKQDEIRVEENRDAVALIQPKIVDDQGSNPIVCDEDIRDQQMLPQHHVTPLRGARRLLVRRNRETLSRTRRS